MSDFDALLADYTSKENPKVHGVICKCVDKHGIPPPSPGTRSQADSSRK